MPWHGKVFFLLFGILMMPEGEAFGVTWSWSPDRGLSRSAWAAMCGNQASYPEGVQVLKSRFAEAPEEELCRFLAKQRGDIEKAAKIYGEAVKWREVRLSNEVAGVEYVPRWMWKFDRDLARDNTTVLWVQGAMYNSTAADADAYVEATARLMESIPADSLETLTVLVDTRAHPGMASEPASKVISYMAKVAPVLNRYFPGRLTKLSVFPVPPLGAALWRSIRPLLDGSTAAKVELFPGSDRAGSAIPVEVLDLVSEEALARGVPKAASARA